MFLETTLNVILIYIVGSSSNYTDDCNAGFHCISGSWTPTPTDFTTGRICPSGQYCPKGTASPEDCPPGTFSNSTGLSTEAQCLICTPGSYCIKAGLTYPSSLCSERYYCSGGAVYPSPSDGPAGGNCTPGHYCKVGTPRPIPCEVGKMTSFSDDISLFLVSRYLSILVGS